MTGGFTTRAAGPDDKDPLLDFCGQAAGPAKEQVADSLRSKDCSWTVGLEGQAVRAAACLSLEREARLGKVTFLRALGPEGGRGGRLAALLRTLLGQVQSSGAADLVYNTTRDLTDEEHLATLDAGFKPLGVFPGARSTDGSQVSGFAAWYAEGVLRKMRHSEFPLHPAAAPFFALAAEACGLPPLGRGEPVLPPYPDSLPALELLDAPRFAAERFRRLKARRSLSVNFYPFSEPNVIILSADENVQVFASLQPGLRFATIIGEAVRSSVHPVRLTRESVRLLEAGGADYVEAINDAADAAGIECFLKAGFTPCGYFPCLKLSGNNRRDFVVFAHSKVRASSGLAVHPAHGRFLDAYLAASGLDRAPAPKEKRP